MEQTNNGALPEVLTESRAKNIVLGDNSDKTIARKLAFAEGESGLHNANDVTRAVSFPSVAKLACSFDASLLKQVGAAVGEQCRFFGADVLFGPDLNVKNTPLCARNYKLFSEDPLLNGELAAAYIAGVQSQSVQACPDGFAVWGRNYGSLLYNSVTDVRALNEIYFAPYRRVLRQNNVNLVRCAPNKLNGEYCCHNAALIDVLRNRWGYNGVVVSSRDGYCVAERAVAAGVDMVRDNCGRNADDLTKVDVDGNAVVVSANRLLKLYEQLPKRERRNIDWEYQHAQSCLISSECTVLAKNNCNLLPFNKADSIAVIGYRAQEPVIQGGSVKPFRQDSVVSALKDAKIDYVYAPGYQIDGTFDEQSVEQARILAEQHSKVIVVVGVDCNACEGDDGWYLPQGQLRVIQAVTDANPNVAVVLQCNSSVDVSWAQSCKALLIDYYGGEHSGKAIVDVIFGDVCPGGRLAETWYDVLPAFIADGCNNAAALPHRESVFFGYRYMSAAHTQVAFPFGYGLTYNALVWQQPAINKTSVAANGKFTIEVNISNQGAHADSEVVQAYARSADARDFCPFKRLIAFKKVKIKRGETKKVTLTVNVEDLASFDVKNDDFCVNSGKYIITVGRNSADDKYSFELCVEGENVVPANVDAADCYRMPTADFNPTAQDFCTLWGVCAQDIAQQSQNKPFDECSALGDIRTTFAGRFLCNKLAANRPRGVSENNALAMPLFAFTGDFFDADMLQISLQMLNGPKRFACFMRLCGKFFAHRLARIRMRIFDRKRNADEYVGINDKQ